MTERLARETTGGWVSPVEFPQESPTRTGTTDTGPQSLLTVQELATRLHVPASWVYQEAERGRIPHLRLGKYLRFEPDTVLAYFRAKGADGNRGPDGVS